ncbi:MAG: VCBS repeat-containing protein [Massilia sp.]
MHPQGSEGSLNPITCADVSPGWFKVWTKAGKIIEFGHSADSALSATGAENVIVKRMWGINKVQDISGNYYTVSYANDSSNGIFYPTQIDYSGNVVVGQSAANSIRFVYEDRPDPIVIYQGGAINKTLKRLINVVTYVESRPVKSYSLSYEQSPSTGRSLWKYFTESTDTSLPSTIFDWVRQTSGSTRTRLATNAVYSAPALAIDVNNDGRVDFVSSQAFLTGTYNSTLIYFELAMSNGTDLIPQEVTSNQYPQQIGVGTTLAWFAMSLDRYAPQKMARIYDDGTNLKIDYYETIGPDSSGKWAFQRMSGGTLGTNANAATKKFFAADVDGDGRQDILSVYNSGGKVAIDRFGASVNVSARFTQLSHTVIDGSVFSTGDRWFAGDVDGDGKAELIRVRSESNSASADVYFSLLPINPSVGRPITAPNVQPVDFGVPLAEFVPRVWETRAGGIWDSQKWFLADVNGDGLADLINVFDDNGRASIDVHISTGTKFQSSRWITGQGPFADVQRWYVGDINGDGRADLINVFNDNQSATTEVRISTGTAFQYLEKWEEKSGGYSDAQKWYLTDVAGQGNSSLVNVFVDSGGKMSFDAHTPSPYGDRIARWTTGLGAANDIKYSNLITQPSRSSQVSSISLPIYVVSALTAPDGIGGQTKKSYMFEGLGLGYGGRMVGFERMHEIDSDKKIWTTTKFRQDWPYTGMPMEIRVDSFEVGQKLLKLVTNQFDCKRYFMPGYQCGQSGTESSFPYISESVVKTYDVNGTPLAPTNKTTVQYDDWGNPTVTTSTTPTAIGDHVTTVTNTYLNDESNWFIGRVKRSTVTKTAP